MFKLHSKFEPTGDQPEAIIGNNVFGISKDMIFSVTTENNIEASKKKDTVDVDI